MRRLIRRQAAPADRAEEFSYKLSVSGFYTNGFLQPCVSGNWVWRLPK